MIEGGSVNAEPHQFRVDLRIKSGITDEVDDPPLRLLGRHVELVCQHAEWGERKRGRQYSSVNILRGYLKASKFPFYTSLLNTLEKLGDINYI